MSEENASLTARPVTAVCYCVVSLWWCVLLQDILNHLINDIEQFGDVVLAAVPKVDKKKKKKRKTCKGEKLIRAAARYHCVRL